MTTDHSQKSLRIVHVVDYLMPKMGYQENLLSKWNAKHGHEVHILTSDRYRPIPDYEDTWGRFLGPRICGSGIDQVDGITVHRLSCRWEWKKRPWMSGLERKLNDLRPDVIFCHGSETPTAFRVAALGRRTGIPVLMDNHMTYYVQNRSLIARIYYKGLKTLSRRLLSHGVSRFLGVAQECCDFLETEQGLPQHQIECLPLGVDTEMFRPYQDGGERIRRENNIPRGAKVVLQTGKLGPDKGAHWLAQAMLEIATSRQDVWLVLVGGGGVEHVEEIRSWFAHRGIEDRLLIIPFVSAAELASTFSMADVCVYPRESSLSCLEAAACGRAVIMTDLPAGVWRAHLGIGVCYRNGDIPDLIRKIEELLGDESRIRELGDRGRLSVAENFSYDAIALRAEDLMYKAIAQHVV